MKLGANIVHLAYLAIGAVLFGGMIWVAGLLARTGGFVGFLALIGLLVGLPLGVGVMQKIGNALNSVLTEEARLWRER